MNTIAPREINAHERRGSSTPAGAAAFFRADRFVLQVRAHERVMPSRGVDELLV